MPFSRCTLHSLAAAALLALAAGELTAQSCLGYPARSTGQLSATGRGTIGSDFWGVGADINADVGNTGVFGSVGAGMRKFVTDPVESRIAYGATIGYERYNRDQLIWCPIVSMAWERGDEVEGSSGPQRTTGRVLSLGVGIGFELERRGPLAFNPYLSVRQSRVTSRIDRVNAPDTEGSESGAVFAFGLGIRIREAIQITPSFSGATFAGSNLVFDLRASVALQWRRQIGGE